MRDAARIMARVQLGADLGDEALDELVAFLEALTGQVPDHYTPPSQFPSEPPLATRRR